MDHLCKPDAFVYQRNPFDAAFSYHHHVNFLPLPES